MAIQPVRLPVRAVRGTAPQWKMNAEAETYPELSAILVKRLCIDQGRGIRDNSGKVGQTMAVGKTQDNSFNVFGLSVPKTVAIGVGATALGIGLGAAIAAVTHRNPLKGAAFGAGIAALGTLAACGSSAPRESSSMGAALIQKYDRNGDGKLTNDLEGTRDIPRSETTYPYSYDANNDGVVGYGEGGFPVTRTWSEEYSILALLSESNRNDSDGDPNVTTLTEIEAVIKRFDRHGSDKKVDLEPDGLLQGDEQKDFSRNWGERQVR